MGCGHGLDLTRTWSLYTGTTDPLRRVVQRTATKAPATAIEAAATSDDNCYRATLAAIFQLRRRSWTEGLGLDLFTPMWETHWTLDFRGCGGVAVVDTCWPDCDSKNDDSLLFAARAGRFPAVFRPQEAFSGGGSWLGFLPGDEGGRKAGSDLYWPDGVREDGTVKCFAVSGGAF